MFIYLLTSALLPTAGLQQSASVSDFDYDPYTGFLCAAFNRRVPAESFATVACFDTQKFKADSKPVFSPFPSLMDQALPEQVVANDDEALTLLRGFLVDEEDLAFDLSAELHRQRLYGRSRIQRSDDTPEAEIVSEEQLPVHEGNELQKPVREPATLQDEIPADADSKTVVPPTLHRKSFHFISVSKIHFDDCGRMWFLDSGTAYSGTEHEMYYRRPILWAFNLAVAGTNRQLYNKLYLRHELMTNVTHNGISDFVVDIHGPKCHDFHVYIANHIDSNLVVYEHEIGEDYAVYDESLTPINAETKHVFLDKEYHLAAGVSSLTLGELNERGHREVYFTLGSGTGQYVFNTKALHKRSGNYFKILGYRGCQVNTLNHVYDSYSQVMFYMHPETNSVRCWNTNRRLIPENIGTVFVHDKLSTGWSIKVDQSNNLWFMSNDFNYFTGQPLDDHRDAMNVFRAKIRKIIRNTVCDVPPTFSNDPQIDEKETFDPNMDEKIITTTKDPITVKNDTVALLVSGGGVTVEVTSSTSSVTIAE